MLTVFSRRERDARAIAERFWQKDPLAFLGICKAAEANGTTLLNVIRWKLEAKGR
jgi:hypothetical protein